MARKKKATKKTATKKTATKKTATKKTATKKTATKKTATKKKAAKKKAAKKKVPATPPPHAELLADVATSGFCLWVGAGLGAQLGASARSTVPLWSELVRQLEQAGGVVNNGTSSFESRLEATLHALGRRQFQRQLRNRCAVPTAKAVLRLVWDWAANPKKRTMLESLSLLGALSTSVVNFNIETASSRLLAAGSAWNLKVFHPPMEGSSGFRQRARRVQNLGAGGVGLNVLHPHGAIDHSGRCVLTASEYRNHETTLGLHAAVHSAFQDNLVIIGMSLADEYLRSQLEVFRDQIWRVLWLSGSQFSGKDLDWAAANNVTTLTFPSHGQVWSAFRDTVDTKLLPVALAWMPRMKEVARNLKTDVEKFARLAFDVSFTCDQADIEHAAGDVLTAGARYVRAQDLGEEPSRRRVFTTQQDAVIQKLVADLAAAEKLF